MDFSRINKVGKVAAFLPTKKLSELTLEKDYTVTDIKTVHTVWGSRVVIEVESEFSCFLPARFVKVFEEDEQFFEQMKAAAHENKLLMCYYGTNLNSLEFKNKI